MSGPLLALGGVFLSAGSLLHELEHAPIALGAVPVGLAVGYLLYRAFRYFRGWSTGAIQIPVGPAARLPVREPVPSATPPRGRARYTWISGEEGEYPVPVPVPPSPPAAPPADPSQPVSATLWSPETGARTLTGDWRPASVAAPPPPSRAFGERVIIAFTGVALVLLLFHRYVFVGIDKTVELVGGALYWPLQWPGLIQNPALQRVLPDFVFITYATMMVAFCLAARVFTDPRFSSMQRWNVAYLFLGYLGSELLVDTASFLFPGRLVVSGFLIVRGFIGGVFLALLIFDLTSLPAPIPVTRKLPRDPRAAYAFALTAVFSLTASVAVLILMHRYLDLDLLLIPFALLLLVPLVALTIWGVVGRLLYEVQIAGRPLPTLEEYHPAVSILIPAFNEEAHIATTIATADAAAARYPGTTEIIVGNDGSTDPTSEVARAAIARLRHARGAVLDLPHGGKSNALNGALSVALGEVVVRIDADARISQTRGFGPMVRHFADPEVGGVQGLILPLRVNRWTGKLRLMEIAWNHLLLRRAMMATRSTQVVDGAFCAFRREDIKSVGGWAPWNGEDSEITLRLARLGYRMRFEEDAAAFEDVPNDYEGLRKQRIRWNRGGLIAHRRHFGALFGDAFEFGGLAIVLWFAFFARGGLRGLVWVVAALVTVLVGLATLFDVALITLLLLIPRGIAIGYYLVKYGKWSYLPYLSIWPVTAWLKQFFSIEAIGTMLPGGLAEFQE